MTTTTRETNGSNTDSSNLPLLPAVTAVGVAGDIYPSLRAVSRSTVDFTGVNNGTRRTWLAMDSLVGYALALTQIRTVGTNGFDYMVMDTAALDYSSVTMTGRRPQNPGGGFARYNTTIGTGKITGGGGLITFASASVVEGRMPVLVDNTVTEAKKLPPICTNILVGHTSVTVRAYFTFTIPAGAGGGYLFNRWLGGDIKVAVANATSSPFNVLVYALPPGTLSADIASSVTIGTVANNSSTTFTAAQLLAAGIVRWNQFVVAVFVTGGAATVTLTLYAPLDLPPPYDCPGYDVNLLKGGYLT